MDRAKRSTIRRLATCAAALALLPATACAGRVVAPAAAAQAPDIVLFIADDMTRADVGIYGSVDARTPNIDRMAAEGTRFTNAYAASPTCTPSRSSLFTGLYPMRNGAHANHSSIRRGIRTLPAYLQALGYRVVIAGKTHVGERADFPFEYFPASVIRPARGGGIRSQLNVAAIDDLLRTRDRAKPIALIVAAFAPHVPWPRNDGYDAAKLTVAANMVDTPELREARTRYLTRVTQADTELGAVRASLAKYSNPANTLLLFTADQGAQFPFSKWTLYDAGIATPLIAVWPGKVAAKRVTPAMVSLVDILPTLQAVGGGTPAKDIDGRNFLPVLLGKADRFHGEVYAAHSGVIKTGPGANIAPTRAIRTPDYKLILNYRTDIRFETAVSYSGGGGGDDDGEQSYWSSWVQRAKTDPKAAATVAKYHQRQPVEFYDMRKDPLEQRNLAADPQYRATIAELRAKLEGWMRQQGEDIANVALPSQATEGRFPYAQ